jgi:glycosyltransferase involved in cell wall biosynthesis
MALKAGIYFAAPREAGGLYQYAAALVRELAGRKTPGIDYTVLTVEGSASHRDCALFPGDFSIAALPKPLSSGNSMARQFSLMGSMATGRPGLVESRAFRSLGLDLCIFPYPTTAVFACPVAHIVAIHDMLHYHYPGFFSPGEHLWRWLVYRGSARSARAVVCDSACTKQDIVRYYGVDAGRISLIPLPLSGHIAQYVADAGRIAAVRTKYGLNYEYALYPAQFWKHKNHAALIRACARLNREKNDAIHLVFTGSAKSAFASVMKCAAACGMKDFVHYLGYVPDEDMGSIYALSRMLVFPTLFDPTAIPVFEAFQMGVPVVSSNVCALAGQVGDAGMLFDPRDTNAMADAIHAVWSDAQLRSMLAARGRVRAAQLTAGQFGRLWERAITGQ